MKRPGMMLYFDMLEPISVLTNAERGKLLTAMLEYGKEGKKPSFQGKLALAWGFVQPKIDRDEGSYDFAVQQRKYAGFCSRRASNGLSKISYEDWLEMDDQQRKRMVKCEADIPRPLTAVDGCQPTTATATTTKTNTNTSLTTAAAADPDPWETEDPSAEAAAAAERKKLKIMNGLLGQGVVCLTDEQTDILLDKMGLDVFDRYVKKLADFIRRNGADVKNHYAMILKWWLEDSAS